MHGRAMAMAAALGAMALFPAPRARADTTDLTAAVEAALARVHDAAEKLRLNDRPGAVGDLEEALTHATDALAAAADPATRAELGTLANKALAKTGAFQKAVQKAGTVMADPNKADLKAAKAAGKAAKSGAKVLSTYAKVPTRGPALREEKAGSAGFHKPDTDVAVHVYPGLDDQGDPCLGTPIVVVIDPYGLGCVDTTPPTPVVQPDGSYLFTVKMGSVGGPARVEVTNCGVTRTLLVYNYGPTGTFNPAVSVTRFNGTYTGIYQGVATVTGFGSQPVNGTVTMTVSDGVITVTAPGPGVGSLTAKGAAGFQGAGGVEGATYTFTGRFTVTSLLPLPGTASASGSWNAVFDGGTALGQWSVDR